jgi:hypothetical protein
LWIHGDFFSVLAVSPEAGVLLRNCDQVVGRRSGGRCFSYAFGSGNMVAKLGAIGFPFSIGDRLFQFVGVTTRPFFGMKVGSH